MDFLRFIAVLLVAMAGIMPAVATPAALAENKEFLRDDRIFSDKDYYYWDKGGKVEMDISLPDSRLRIFESLLKLESIDGEKFNLVLLAYPESLPEFLWIHQSEVERLVPNSNPLTDTLTLVFTFHGSKVSLQLPDTTFSLPAQGLRSDQAYRIHTLEKANPRIALSDIRGWRHLSDKEESPIISTGVWIAIVVLVDAIVFFIVHYRRKHQKRLQQKELESKTALIDHHSTVQFPHRNAIYLFGELQVLDNEGQEVSGKFSPLLRELFLVLLLKTPEGGITSPKLTELLWFDKDEASAKNNRSVNLHKLRTLLAGVGNCKIERVGGKWQINFDDDTYIDYYECLSDKIQPEKLSADRVKILSAMTLKGGLLPSSDYLWLDKYKSRMTDNLIGGLLKYASILGEHEAPETKLYISDIVFSFDSTNEFALRLKCLTYQSINKQYMAKRAYEHFCRTYRELYGEDFTKSYNNIVSL